MPFCKQGNITGLQANRSDSAPDFLADNDAEVLAYLAMVAAPTQDQIDLAAVKADAQIVAFFNKTPAQIDAYVATIANLADAKVALAILAKAVLVLARKSLKNGGS